jgi:two-component system cell cycle response regulator
VREIMVVGSSRWISRDLAGALRERGDAVMCVDDGAVAAEHALSAPPQAVLIELDLPGISGAQLCQLLQSDPSTANVPLLLLTASASGPSRLWARSLPETPCVGDADVDMVLKVLDRVLAGASPRPRTRAAHVGPRGVLERLSRVVEGSFFDAVVAAQVRALATAEDLESLFAWLSGSVSEPLGYDWLALRIDGDAPRAFLHARPETRAYSESEARSALGVPENVHLGLVLDERPAAPVAASVTIDAPMLFGATRVGQLAIGVAPSKATPALTRLVRLIAYELGGPLRVQRLMNDARLLASTDPLTGLMNRRAFMDAVERERARATRTRTSGALALLDVDHFKRVNDECGHDAGDAVLVQVAEIVRSSTRASDLVARVGGEELVVFLPDTCQEDAVVAMERVRQALRARLLPLPQGGARRVTASFGVAWAEAPWDPAAMLRSADAAMYEAKRLGRDRVVAAGLEAAPPSSGATRTRRALKLRREVVRSCAQVVTGDGTTGRFGQR